MIINRRRASMIVTNAPPHPSSSTKRAACRAAVIYAMLNVGVTLTDRDIADHVAKSKAVQRVRLAKGPRLIDPSLIPTSVP